MKEFGIRKQDVIDQAAKTMRGKEIVNNKGQITDQKRFNEALMQLMEKRFQGGMEKQSKSMRGLWSTVTDIYKTSLARIIGIADDGSIKAGSAYEYIKGKVDELGQWMNKLVDDGTVTRIGNAITENLPKAIQKVQELKDKAVEIYTYIKDNWSTISTTIQSIVTVLIVWRTLTAVVTTAIAIKTTVLGAYRLILNIIIAAQWAWNVAMSANPISLIIIAVAGLVAGLTALGVWFVKNTEVGAKFWERTKEIFRQGVNWVAKIIDSMIETLNKIPGVEIKFRASSLIDNDDSSSVSASTSKSSKPSISQYATGTSFARGGLTRINERGGELVELPSGTKVLPADKTNKLIEKSNGGDTYQIIIHGNVYGEQDLINKVGNAIFKQVKTTKANM
ncbi:hypothetical protein ACFSL6_24960 [Paenibacillus thailandensis]|uniref:Uncharacterized protein n=1 Tax=Paenibacillus thailandensis TaxID=393250 RepID=A0ABW5R3S6_9BACL